jgi:hypothetical protein
MPAITIFVATMYWARSLYINFYLSKDFMKNTNLYYLASNETLSSTNVTFDAHWLLYLVLCLQSILTIFMFLATIVLYDTPIDNDFNLVAILSSIDKNSLDTMHDAALSNELSRSMNLNIEVLGDVGENMVSRRLRYTIGDEEQGKPKLRREMKYK